MCLPQNKGPDVYFSPFNGLANDGTMSDHQSEAPLTLAEYQAIVDVIADSGHRKVLDWGCGYGYSAKYLANRGIDVSLFDYSPLIGDNVTTTLTLFPELEATVSSDPVRLPYPDESFDAVLSLGTLEHVSDPQGSLAELRRILRPGGHLYVHKLPNPTSYVEYLAKRKGMYYHGAREHDRLYTLAQARALLEGAGFRVLRAQHRNMFPLKHAGRVVPPRFHSRLRDISDVLSATPGLRRLSTNVEVIGVKHW